MSNGKKKQFVKVKSLVSNYEVSDEEQEDMSSDQEAQEDEQTNSEEMSENDQEKDENKTTNDLNENLISNDGTGIANRDDRNLESTEALSSEPFQAYKLTPENGFLPGSENIKLPPAPKELCSKELQDKIIQVRRKMIENNYNLNQEIRKNKSFKNPSIYEKFIKHYDLDEFGSSFSSYITDLKEEGYTYYDELDNIQRREWKEKEKEKEKKEKSKVEVVVGTRKPRIDNK